MFDTISVGDRVTVRTPQGEQTGRATIHNVGVRLWVLDIDGKPWLATPDSVVKVGRAKAPLDAGAPGLKEAMKIEAGRRASQIRLHIERQGGPVKAKSKGTTSDSAAMTPGSLQAHESNPTLSEEGVKGESDSSGQF